ncbi:flavin reductase family protein [Pseudophaeobacter flagellatus]|uniref:flavin reductase family protein n=1 Tax=Pseudophaeobacter flagellatus TaxID=2899119 RepID=UPI001E6589E5|nr:flavin reductase family protein [Pseudophaeobacter flagellatus]MCD9147574.1 flavin reductase family protein [Pseudophaeobacter flagellatus]
MSETSFTPGADTLRAYRDALGSFATGVTVVTTLTKNGPLAITVNSFTSVSMDPPLLLWCPDRSSLRHDAFVAAQRFSIHVLAEDQFDMAQHFALHGDGFTQDNWQLSPAQTPALRNPIARFDCRLYQVHPAGDHSIVLGEVTQVTSRPGNGLVFKRGQYGGFLQQP